MNDPNEPNKLYNILGSLIIYDPKFKEKMIITEDGYQITVGDFIIQIRFIMYSGACERTTDISAYYKGAYITDSSILELLLAKFELIARLRYDRLRVSDSSIEVLNAINNLHINF